MSLPINDLFNWLNQIIPASYIPLKHRWVEQENEQQTRFWILYSNGGIVDGSQQINPNMRLILMGKRVDRDIDGISQLASDIITQATDTDNFMSGCLALIQPLQWVSPVGFTEENRPFVEITFTTIIK